MVKMYKYEKGIKIQYIYIYIYIYIYFIPLGYDYFIITKICKLIHSFML